MIEPAWSDILEDVAQIAAQPMNRYGSDLPGQQHCKNASFALLKKYGHEGQDAMREAVGLGGWVSIGSFCHEHNSLVCLIVLCCLSLSQIMTMALVCVHVLLPAARTIAWHWRTVPLAKVVCCHVFILPVPLCSTFINTFAAFSEKS